ESSMQAPVPACEVPTTIGNRPAALLMKTSATRRRSDSVSLWNSPMMPRTLRPCTPQRASNSTSETMLSSSTRPSGWNGVAVIGITPARSVMGPSRVAMVGALVVGAERVHAEVVSRIVPDRVDVVRPVLRVVVLDEERRAVQAGVVGVPRGGWARPREAHVLDAGLTHPAKLVVGDVGSHVTRVRLDQAQRQRSRLGAEVAERDAGRRLEAVGTARPADDVTRGGGRDHEAAAEARIDTTREREREILLLGERTLPALRPRGYFGRIGAEERGGHRDGTAGHECEVEREMVALEAPAPGRRRLRRAEHAHVVFFGVAQDSAERLQLAQDLLELHHVGGLRVADSGERGLHQLV